MFKKISAFLCAICLAVGSFFAFTGCSTSAEFLPVTSEITPYNCVRTSADNSLLTPLISPFVSLGGIYCQGIYDNYSGGFYAKSFYNRDPIAFAFPVSRVNQDIPQFVFSPLTSYYILRNSPQYNYGELGGFYSLIPQDNGSWLLTSYSLNNDYFRPDLSANRLYHFAYGYRLSEYQPTSYQMHDVIPLSLSLSSMSFDPTKITYCTSYVVDISAIDTNSQSPLLFNSSVTAPFAYSFYDTSGNNLTFYSYDFRSRSFVSQTLFTRLYEPPEGTYQQGYNTGYTLGVAAGVASGNTQGYTEGYNVGHSDGYSTGYLAGASSSNEYTFMGLIGAVFDAPVKAFMGLLSFDVFGVDLSAFVLTLFSLCIVIKIVQLIL